MAMNWGADNPLWAMLAGGGAGMLSAGPGQSQLGGGLMGMLQGGQMAQQMKQAQQMEAFRQMQMADMKRKQEQESARQTALQGLFQRPPVQYAMAGDGRPGPTPEAAGRAQPPIAQMFPGTDVNALQSYATAFPEQFAQVMGQRMLPKDRAPVSVAPGASLVDPTTGKPIFTAPEKTPDWKDPEYQKFQFQKARAGKTDVTLNTGDKGLTELDVDTIKAAEEGVRKARTLLPDLDRLEAAIRMFPTGVGGSQVLAFKQAMERLGVKVDGTSEGEIIQSIQSRLAPAMRATGSGASSDRDVQMFLDSLPNLFKTREGNLKVIQHLRRIATRQQQEAQYMRNYFRKNGNKLDGVYEAMDKDLGPIFPRPKSEADMRALPSGEVFVAPDGTMRIVP